MRRDLVTVASAISAGIHGALIPGHFADGAGPGLGFVAATALLAGSAAAITFWPASELALAAAVTVFAGLLVSHALATTVGLPVVHPTPEPVDSASVSRPRRSRPPAYSPQEAFCGDQRSRRRTPHD